MLTLGRKSIFKGGMVAVFAKRRENEVCENEEEMGSKDLVVYHFVLAFNKDFWA